MRVRIRRKISTYDREVAQPEDLEELFSNRMREAGLRMTMPRRAISRVLADSDHEFLSAAMILERVVDRFGQMDASTVYRTLDELERLGLVHHVHLGTGQPGMWHLMVDVDHQHLVCENCGKTIEVPAADLEPTYRVLGERYGFTPNTHHFTILGFCQDCSDSS